MKRPWIRIAMTVAVVALFILLLRICGDAAGDDPELIVGLSGSTAAATFPLLLAIWLAPLLAGKLLPPTSLQHIPMLDRADAEKRAAQRRTAATIAAGGILLSAAGYYLRWQIARDQAGLPPTLPIAALRAWAIFALIAALDMVVGGVLGVIGFALLFLKRKPTQSKPSSTPYR